MDNPDKVADMITYTCCIEDCEAAGTLHANHENASLYCEQHGHCRRCEMSVEYFVFVAEIGNHGAWICPCVAADRHPVEQRKQSPAPSPMPEEKKPLEFVVPRARAKRMRKIV